MSMTFWRLRKQRAAKLREQERQKAAALEKDEAKPKKKKVSKNDGGADSES